MELPSKVPPDAAANRTQSPRSLVAQCLGCPPLATRAGHSSGCHFESLGNCSILFWVRNHFMHDRISGLRTHAIERSSKAFPEPFRELPGRDPRMPWPNGRCSLGLPTTSSSEALEEDVTSKVLIHFLKFHSFNSTSHVIRNYSVRKGALE